MYSNLMDKYKILVIFFRHWIKYFTILIILLVMLMPLVSKSYSLAKNRTIEKSDLKLKEGLNFIASQVVKATEISNLIQKEDSYRRLFFLRGFPSSEHYVDINALQTKLSSLSLTQDMFSDAYIVFRDNPVFLSNYFSSDNMEKAYETFFHYQDMSFDQWHRQMFDDDYIIKYLPSSPVFSFFYNRDYFEGVTFLINNYCFDSSGQNSVMACILNKKDILGKLLYEDELADHFLYITDPEDHIILTHNYSGNEIIPDASNLNEITLSSKKYILLTYKSDKIGLSAVLGIPSEIFEKNTNSMLELVIVYIVAGMLITVVLSLLFAIKETLWMKKLVDAASKSVKTKLNKENEYSFINNAITRINSINQDQLCQIEALNDSIRCSALKNALILGVHTEKEKLEIESNFNNRFNHYCIAKINYRVDESVQVEKAIQQNFVLDIEKAFKMIDKNEFAVLNLLSNESIFVLFFDQNDPSNIAHAKAWFTELVRTMSSDCPIPLIINIGLSDIAYDVKDAKTAYQQATYALSIHENSVASGVYAYEPTTEHSDRKAFDIAVLLKLYDAIIAGEKSLVSQIFCDYIKGMCCSPKNLQEQLQIFFSFRQAVANAHRVILDEKSDGEKDQNILLPEYGQVVDIKKLFHELETAALSLCDLVMENKKSNNEKLKADIMEYINSNYGDISLSAHSIASALLISEKYVFAFVKEQTGKSLGKFIEDVRLEKAEKLLLETSYSNSKILQMCGFGSDNTFYRTFSKKHSVSPTIWRENYRVNTD